MPRPKRNLKSNTTNYSITTETEPSDNNSDSEFSEKPMSVASSVSSHETEKTSASSNDSNESDGSIASGSKLKARKNIPSRNKNTPNIASTLEVVEHENVIYIKDSADIPIITNSPNALSRIKTPSKIKNSATKPAISSDEIPTNILLNESYDSKNITDALNTALKTLYNSTEKSITSADNLNFLEIKLSGKHFKCPFSFCTKMFLNKNGLKYHLDKSEHDCHETLKNLGKHKDTSNLLNLPEAAFPIVAKDFRYRFPKEKKISTSDLKFSKSATFKLVKGRPSKNIEKSDLSSEPHSFFLKRNDMKADVSWIKPIDYNTYDLVSQDEALEYLPVNSDLKIAFKDSKQEKIQYSIPLFGAISHPVNPNKNHVVLNAGGSIWGLDFCPVPDKHVQYIASAGLKSTDHEHPMLNKPMTSQFPEDPRLKYSIQIWRIESNDVPFVEMCILHDYGYASDLRWCPSITTTSNNFPRLGILGVSFGDGSCRIFDIPKPENLAKYFQNSDVVKNSLFPKTLFVKCSSPLFEVMIPDTLLWKLDWLSNDTIVNGCSDGTIVSWCVRPFLQNSDDELPIPEPSSMFYVHDSAIRQIRASRLHPNFFQTCGYDGKVLLHDIRQPWCPLPLGRYRALISGVSWVSNNVVFTDDQTVRINMLDQDSLELEDMSNRADGISIALKTTAISKHSVFIFDIAGSDHMPFVASVSDCLVISNVNRTKRHSRPIQLTCYTLEYTNDTLIFVNRKPEEISQKITGFELNYPETNVQKVVCNTNEGHEWQLASAGKMGFIRIEEIC